MTVQMKATWKVVSISDFMKKTLRIAAHYDVPIALQIEITSHCNLNCQMCPLPAGKTLSSQPPGPISRKVWEALLPIARETEKVILAGYGEPFVHRQCAALLAELNRLDIRMGIATNGIPITPAIAEQLARLPHLIHINVSIDSPDAALYRDIRGGELEKALQGVAHLMAAIGDPQRVTVSSVLMHKTLASLVDFPPLLAKLGVQRYCLQGLIDHNPDLRAEHLLHYQDVAGTLETLQQACAQAGIELLFASPQRLDLELREPVKARMSYFQSSSASATETRQCYTPWENPYIDKDGRVFPCCNSATEADCVMGHLKEQNFVTIWQGAAFQQFRRAIVDGRTMPAICRQCSAAPLGEHPFRLYAAEISFEQSQLDDPKHLRLVVKNTGLAPWTRENSAQIGTANPQDRPSIYFHPDWTSANRITAMDEDFVAPGAIATFHFRVTPVRNGFAEIFQLLIPNTCWLPGTCFAIRPLLGFSFPRLSKYSLQRVKRAVLKRPAPAGEHWLQVYAAQILRDQSVLSGSDELRLMVKNTGTCYWTQETRLLIGTAEPPDHPSAYAHPSWLNATRIDTFTEPIVAPGETATFRFQVTRPSAAAKETFQLVLEGKSWLPGTCFNIQ